MSSIEELIREGEFQAALASLREQTRGETPDLGLVLMTFSLEVRLHQFGQADVTLDRLSALSPQLADGLNAYRMCAHAERARTLRLIDPSAAGQRAALMPPPPFAYAYIRAATACAQGDHAAVVTALAEANAQRPAVSGTLTRSDGTAMPFVDLLDSDDLTGATLPCFAGGQLLDIPYVQLRAIRFVRGSSSFDAMWLPTEIATITGDVHRLRVPALYTGTGVAEEPAVRTGLMTSWNHDHGYARGVGQRDFKVSKEGGGFALVGALQVARIEFDAGSEGSAGGPDGPPGFFQRSFS
jgi:protein involved in temperature-dependent protein secretion